MMWTSPWTSPEALSTNSRKIPCLAWVSSRRLRSPSFSAWFIRTRSAISPTVAIHCQVGCSHSGGLDHRQGRQICVIVGIMGPHLGEVPLAAGAVGVELGDEGQLMGGVSRWSGVRSVVPSYRRMYQDGPAKLNKSPSIRGPAFAADPGRTTARPDPDRDDHERPTRPRRLARARDDPRGAGRRGPPGRGRESAARSAPATATTRPPSPATSPRRGEHGSRTP